MSAGKQEIRPQDRQFLGHPIGLWVLFTTEMWERFCYYGMRAFLVMYLYFSVNSSNPGFGWSEKEAYELYGWFTGLVYLFPLLGGFVADRFIGQHRSVLYGGMLIAAGEFCLFFTEYFRQAATSSVTLASWPLAWLTFMAGLSLIIVGTGFFKPCISVMVGQLYSQHDNRRDTAFTIFYMGINLGALMAPLVAGTIAEKIGWHWGFLTAGIGMIFGLLTYSLFRPRYLGHIGMMDSRPHEDVSQQAQHQGAQVTAEQTNKEAGKATSLSPAKKSLTRVEIDRVAVILVLSFFCIAFWSVFEQAGSSLNTFAKIETNRRVPSFLAGGKLDPFLANEDESDAEAALNSARLDLANAAVELEVLGEQIIQAKERLLTEGKNTPELLARVRLFDQNSSNIREMLEIAQWARNKAEHARKQAGMAASHVVIPELAQILEEGKKIKADLETLVATRCEESFVPIAEAARKAGKSEAMITAERVRFAEGVIRDHVRSNKVAAEKARLATLDKADTLFTFPATWYQSVNPIAIVLLAPLFVFLWSFLAKRNLEPSTPVKFGIGLVFLSFAYLLMVPAGIQAESSGGNAAAHWLLSTYLLCTLGELCLSPVGLSMVSRLAPTRYASLMMGIWFVSSAIACYLSGKLAAVFGSAGADGEGRIYFMFGPNGGMADYFFIMAMIPLVAGLIVFTLAPMLRRMMHEET